MRKLRLSMFTALLMLLLPALAAAGNGDPVGACYVIGVPEAFETLGTDGGLAGCADGLTQAECESVDELTEWAQGFTCQDVADKAGFTWDGSCLADIDPLGQICIVLWTEIGGPATQALCENDIGGMWFDDLTCGLPVPTMPAFGLAVMVLLLLGGALIVLTVRGSLLGS